MLQVGEFGLEDLHDLAVVVDELVALDGVERGRERMIFASEVSRSWLAARKKFGRRTQIRLRCSDRTPRGEFVPPPGRGVVSNNRRRILHART